MLQCFAENKDKVAVEVNVSYYSTTSNVPPVYLFKWSKDAVPHTADQCNIFLKIRHVCILEQLLEFTWISIKHQQHYLLCHQSTTMAFCYYPISPFVSYFQVGNHRCQLRLQGRWDNCASPLEISSIIIHCLLLQYVCPRWQERKTQQIFCLTKKHNSSGLCFPAKLHNLVLIIRY